MSKKWEEAKQCLLEYEKNKRAKEPLHQQFIEQEYAQIAWLRGKSVETVCEHLEKAIVQTMPEAEIQRKTGILSAEEYKLLLFDGKSVLVQIVNEERKNFRS